MKSCPNTSARLYLRKLSRSKEPEELTRIERNRNSFFVTKVGTYDLKYLYAELVPKKNVTFTYHCKNRI